VNGIFSHIWRFFGANGPSWLSGAFAAIDVLIVSWQVAALCDLILLTAFQAPLDSEQLKAEMDGAPPKSSGLSSCRNFAPRSQLLFLIQTNLPAVLSSLSTSSHRRCFGTGVDLP